MLKHLMIQLHTVSNNLMYKVIPDYLTDHEEDCNIHQEKMQDREPYPHHQSYSEPAHRAYCPKPSHILPLCHHHSHKLSVSCSRFSPILQVPAHWISSNFSLQDNLQYNGPKHQCQC